MKKVYAVRLVSGAILLAAGLFPIRIYAAPGDLYVASGRNSGSGAIFRFTPDGTKSTFASGLDPFGLAFDSSGNLFEADNDSGTIFKFTREGIKSTFASVSSVTGLAFDAFGNLYASSRTGIIVKLTPDGTQTTFASDSGQLRGLAFDSSGNLFVVSFNRFPDEDCAIFKITPDGTKSSFASLSPGSAPAGLAFDSSGDLLVTDDGNGIYKFTPGGQRTTFASDFDYALGLAFDVSGNLFVTELRTGDIVKFATGGSRSIFANAGPRAFFLAFEPGSATATPGQLLNISTRLGVQTGDNVLIGGFIITGTAPKKVILRAIGPSLANSGVQGFLPDPTLELRDSNGVLLVSNDDWKINDQTQQSQEAEIRATTIPPSNDLESAIIATLNPGQGYTAIVRGKGTATGIGLVEAYDLAQGVNSLLANISTRGFVETGNNVMIGGLILGGASGPSKVMVRAIGPSLTQSGITNALADPTLELHDSNGALLVSNDNWKINDQTQQSQEADIRATTIPPSNDLESAIVATVPAGAYTAIVAGKGGGTGVGVVEVYNLH